MILAVILGNLLAMIIYYPSSVDYETKEFLSALSFVLLPLWAQDCTVVTGE